MLAVEGEREPTFDQVDRVATEDFATPASERMHVAFAGGQPIELVRASDEARSDACLLGF